LSSRSWTSSKIYLIPLTLYINVDNRHPLIEWQPADTFGAPIPVTLPQGSADTSVIRFDEMPYGSSLTNIAVKTRGLAGGGSGFTLPSYKIVSWSDAEGTGFTDLSAATADAHTSGNWTSTYVTTTITVSAPVTITRGVNYGLLVTHPYDSDLLGASVGFFSCIATGATGELRN
jgi:hypothetical protein